MLLSCGMIGGVQLVEGRAKVVKNRWFRWAASVALMVLLAGCASGSAEISSAEVSADGLRLWLNLSSCWATHDIVVEESADAVTIEAVITGHEERPPDFDDYDCRDIVPIVLPSPLGDRRVIDASTGEEVPLFRGNR